MSSISLHTTDGDLMRSRSIALAVTVALAAVIVLLLLWLKLTYPPAEPPIWADDESEILLADEYLTIDEIIPVAIADGQQALGEPVQGPEAAPAQAPSNDVVTAGNPGPAPVVQTQTKAAPVQTIKQEVPKQTGTPQPKAEPQESKTESTSAKIQSDVGNAFSSANKDSRGANPNANANPSGGNTTQAANGTSPGVSWSSGGGWAVAQRPALAEKYRQKRGSVTIQITVDANGKVVKAEHVGGTPPAGADPQVIAACMQLAKQYTFKRTNSAAAPAQSVGRITWKI